MQNIVYEENKKLANDFLNDLYYDSFKKGNKAIELFLLGSCKANCQYCYLKKYQSDLYPQQFCDFSLIINNLEKILNWYIDNKFTCKFDIFSGEWLTTPLADKVFDLFENKFAPIEEKYRPKTILMADNGHFLQSEYYTAKVEDYIARMEKLNINVIISLSVDGYYCDYNRQEHDEKFYNTLYDFCVKYNYGIHPMVSSDNVKYWIQNYKWWKNTYPEISKNIMMLEIRDDTWNEESIQDLIKFCDFLIDAKYEEYNQDKSEFLKYIFNLFGRINRTKSSIPYNPIQLHSRGINDNLDRLSCAMYNNLIIRVGDLSVGPCHRLMYPEQLFGFYNSNNDTITDFEPKNVSALIAYKKIKRSCLPYCENCFFHIFCPGHCFGASYETYGNSFVPIKEVCNLYKAKITFVLYKLDSLNLFDEEGISFLKTHLNSFEYQQFHDLYTSIIKDSSIKKELT